MSYNNTSTNEHRQAGSGLADKTSSVFHLVHGAGENLRGTLLGAVDTIAKSPAGEAQNDAIATKGRAEMSKAMETSRNPGNHTGPYPRTTETAGNYQSSAYSDPNVYPGRGAAAPGSVGATGTAAGHEGTFPNHHRDDAISGLPTNQVQDLQGLGQTTQNEQVAGGYPSGESSSYGSGGQQQHLPGNTYANDSQFKRPFN